MKKLFFILSLFVFLNPVYGQNSGLPATFKAGGEVLQLNGSGIRSKYYIDLLRGGLYLKSKSSDAQKIIEADEVMVIHLVVISSLITTERLQQNMRKQLKKAAGDNFDMYEARTDDLINAFDEKVNLNDVFDLIYYPGKGLKIYKNGNLKTMVKGLDFKQLIFTTWFGKDPADEDFKKGLLGKE